MLYLYPDAAIIRGVTYKLNLIIDIPNNRLVLPLGMNEQNSLLNSLLINLCILSQLSGKSIYLLSCKKKNLIIRVAHFNLHSLRQIQ